MTPVVLFRCPDPIVRLAERGPFESQSTLQ